MRIAVITTYPPSGGSLNEYAFHFVRHLRQKADVDDVIVIGDELPSHEQELAAPDEAGLAPLRIERAWRFGGWLNTPRILRAIRRTSPDIVLFNIQFASFGKRKIPATLGLLAPALSRLSGVPTVVLLHNLVDTVDLQNAGFARSRVSEALLRIAGNLLTRVLLLADRVALTIPKYVELLESKYRADNVLLAPHGSFADRVPSFDLPAGPTQLMTFGKFGTYKRVEVLIEAFRLLQTGSARALELVIAGSDSPNTPGYLANIQQRYADVPNIRYTGYVAEEDVPQLFTDATIVVFPYNSTTGSSGVLHQAGDYGKAVVLPMLGDLAELVQEEGYGGEFFEPENPASLAEALTRLLDDPARCLELGRQNWLAANGLSIGDVVDWYIFHFQDLLDRRQPKPVGASVRSTMS
jgi:glycosyltransferase involved in cell wall biosynthesis